MGSAEQGRSRLLALAALSIFLAGVARAEIITGPAEVVDGDTLRITGRPVRLDGIDAPESRQECEHADGSSYRCGTEASRFLARLIGNQDVRCEVLDEDAYERAVGTCRAEKLQLKCRDGARRLGARVPALSHAYVGEERQAEAARAGLWAGSFDPPWAWRAEITAEASPGDCVIKGNISRSGERIYHMPFHQRYDQTKIDEDAGDAGSARRRRRSRRGGGGRLGKTPGVSHKSTARGCAPTRSCQAGSHRVAPPSQ